MRAADDDRATNDVTGFFSFVNTSGHYYPSQCLSEAVVPDCGVAVRSFVRALVLPSHDRCLVVITRLAAAAAGAAAAIALLLTILYGCGQPKPVLDRADGSKAAAVAPILPVASSPLRIVLLQDETGSADETRTPRLTADQLHQAIAVCRSGGGGEVLLGAVRDESNRLFVRFTILPPPSEPIFQPKSNNPIAAQAEKHAYDAAHADWAKAKNAWVTAGDQEEARFIADAERLLTKPSDAPRSDVHGALTRADLAAGENDAAFGASTHRYIVAISDAIDNVHKPAPELTSGATLIIVNGAGSLGTIADLHPQRFENIDAALRYIAARESAHGVSRK